MKNLSAVIALTIFTTGCVDNSDTKHKSDQSDAGVTTGKDASSNSEIGRNVQITMGEDGGALEIEEMKIQIPQGALSQEVEINIKVVTPPVAIPDDYVLVSNVYECAPHGIEFEKPVRIEIPYEEKTGRPHYVIRLDGYEDTSWETADSATFEKGVALLEVETFSFFAVVYRIERGTDADTATTNSDASLDSNDVSSSSTSGSAGGTGGYRDARGMNSAADTGVSSHGCSPSLEGESCTSDGLVCTDDVCRNSECIHELQNGFCIIDGSCYEDTHNNPINDCQYCDLDTSAFQWSNKPLGSSCGDITDDDCTEPDTCDGSGECQNNHVEDDTSCTTDGLSCTDDACNGGLCVHKLTNGSCLIDGTCYSDDDDNPTNDCQYCDADEDTQQWHDKISGTLCGDPTDNECTNPDTCNETGTCQDNHEPVSTPCSEPTGDHCAEYGCDDDGVCQLNMLLCNDNGTLISCCDYRLVTGGTFPMGLCGPEGTGCSDEYGDWDVLLPSDEIPEHSATVADFYLDTFEVTVGRFRKFIEQYPYHGSSPATGAGAHPLIEGSGWPDGWTGALPSKSALISELNCFPSHQTWTNAPGDNEQYPMNCVNWLEAFAFCIWDGGRLPTEAEWEYVAAGGELNQRYPWGPEDPWGSEDPGAPLRANDAASANHTHVDVGSYPAGSSLWGHHDMAGSVEEWVLDFFQLYSGDPCNNCANIETGGNRVIRGGHFNGNPQTERAASRAYDNTGAHTTNIGFRCARDVP